MASYGLPTPSRSRRAFVPRGKGRANAPGRNPFERKEPSEAQIMENLTDKVDFISLPASQAEEVSGNSIAIGNFEVVASYSWDDAVSPTMIVPASPPVWRNRPMPYAVPRDSGLTYVDHNASRLSSSPLLPLIAAVSHLAPRFDFSSVDFVTDRNGLRKLLRWASGGENAGTFRIDLEFVGVKTIIMQRWEIYAVENGGPGYEKEFEKASTRLAPGCETATGHTRIITYDLDGLKMLVRYRTDACLPTQPAGNVVATKKTNDFNDLSAAFGNLTVHQTEREIIKIPTFDGNHLNIITEGNLVPQSSLLELKTRSIKSVDNFDWNESYPQLLLSQTPHMFVCVHDHGTFTEVRKKTLEELKTGEVARKTADGLRKLKRILEEIREIVLGEGEGAMLSLVCKKEGKEIVLYKREGTGASLPKEMLQKFEP
ncbi:hypothetical protein BU17DRAFT_92788 [Hysterangium stoloniferum]|nr:hypothetical protein BU17DRAFT_92788 [Hysterangium stoloniferum]